MKLLTLNCHSWQEENQVEKIKYLASVIKEKQYDVIALQEVSQRIDAKSVDSRIKEDNFAKLLIALPPKMMLESITKAKIWKFKLYL